MEEVSVDRVIQAVTYNGGTWVDAWNLDPAIARLDKLLKGIRYSDGSEEVLNQ